jgi:DNA-binding transcriptional ArsR family regulator
LRPWNGISVRRPDRGTQAPSALFAALGDPTRLRLVVRLSRGEALSITDLARGTKVTRQAVTKHLHVLAGAGLAAASRLGREQRWSLDPGRLAEARRFLDGISQQWDDVLARLKATVEEDQR